MRVVKWTFVFVILGAATWIAFKWFNSKGISSEALNFIPKDAVYHITTNDPISTWKSISESSVWSHLQQNTYFAALTASANRLDSLIQQNSVLFDLIGSRSLMVSAHMTSPKKHDFLFLVDLKQASGIKFVKDYLTNFATRGLIIKKEKYNEEDLILIYDPAEKNTLYITLPETYLLASYSKKIITSALDGGTAADSLETSSIVKPELIGSHGGTLQLYLNYSQLPNFMTCYMNGSNEYVNRLATALLTTHLTISLEESMVKATGSTFINDSIESYVKTLSASGKATTEFTEIAPNRTAFCLGLGFSSFREFYSNFEKNLQDDITEFNSYKENLRQVENYLNISVEKNLISWIGDEVALIEMQSSGKGLDNETALILKADNIEQAKNDLAYIEKMVRRKTPVKFKSIDYHGYTISYLSMKGMFKILLGKFFARYDKPYYTVINNFVVFSNHPQTLENIIDDYLGKQVLVRSEAFRSFRKQFDDEGSVFIYLNTPVLFNTIKKLADQPTGVSMEKNKDYIVCFKQIGFQLVPSSGGFNTTFAEQFEKPAPKNEPLVASMTSPDPDSVANEEDQIAFDEEVQPGDADPMALPYIYAQNLNAASFSGYFPDSTLHFQVSLKNGFKDGSYIEYYPGGEVKMKGHFKADKRDGIWRLFDENGKLIMKRNYRDGDITKEKSKD